MERAEQELMSVDSEVVSINGQEQILELAEKRTQWVGEVLKRSLAILRTADIVSIEGVPYVSAKGAYRVARLFGVKISYGGKTPTQQVRKDNRGEYYIYTQCVVASLPNGIDSCETIGTCSSRDKFFAFAHGVWKEQSEVDETDIILKCCTNGDRRSIVRLLGIDGVSWDELAQFAKIKQQDVQSFSFKKPASPIVKQTYVTGQKPPNASVDKGAAEPQAAKSAPATTSPTPSDTITDMRNICLEAIKAAIAGDDRFKGKKIGDVVKELSGGKVSLGLCNEDELSMMIDKLNS